MNPASGIMTSEGIGGKTFSMIMSKTIPQYAVAAIMLITQVAIYVVLRLLVV
jgi:hypothetical protein